MSPEDRAALASGFAVPAPEARIAEWIIADRSSGFAVYYSAKVARDSGAALAWTANREEATRFLREEALLFVEKRMPTLQVNVEKS